MQAFLEQARTDGARPKRTASGALIVRSGTRYKTLVNNSGRTTPAGRAWQALGQDLPDDYDFGQPYREGNVEYLKVRGKDRVLRSYDAAANNWAYTAQGKQYYRDMRMQWVVKVPSVHSGTRSNGRPYSRRAFFPLEAPLDLPMTLTQAQRDSRIRDEVRRLYPDGLLAEFSEERIIIDPTGAWSISEMVTTGRGDGAPDTIITDRPMGARPSISQFLFPEHLCAAAFEDHADFLCVARQIAQVRGLQLEEVVGELDECAQELQIKDWQRRGATSRMVFLYAKRNDIGACCLHCDRVIETAAGKQPLVWAVHGSHAYFYLTRRVCKQLAARIPCTYTKVRREATVMAVEPASMLFSNSSFKADDGR